MGLVRGSAPVAQRRDLMLIIPFDVLCPILHVAPSFCTTLPLVIAPHTLFPLSLPRVFSWPEMTFPQGLPASQGCVDKQPRTQVAAALPVTSSQPWARLF